MRPTLRAAYAVTRRNGRTSYRCRAYVKSDTGIVSNVLGLGDSAAEARTEAVRHVRNHFARAERLDVFEGLAHDDAGRVPGATLDALRF